MSVSDISVGSKLLGHRAKPGPWPPARRSAAFQAALANVQFVRSFGQIRLDQNHQAAGAVYFSRYQRGGGGGVILCPVHVVGNVDEIFGRRFHTSGPLSRRRYPPRKRGDPPPRIGPG